MQKKCAFFRNLLRKSTAGLLWTVLLLGGCKGRGEVGTTVSTHLSSAPTHAVTTLPRPTERPVTTLSPVTDAPKTTDDPVSGFAWDPYVFDRLSGDYQEDAARLARAILDYAPSAMLSADVAEILCHNFAFEFPPAALVDLHASGDTVEITYVYPKERHQQLVQAFEEQVNRGLSLVTRGDGELKRAILLYNYVVEHVSYFATDYTDREITAFSALVQGETICYGFADAFGYLLRQTGMEAHLWRGGTYTFHGFSEHGWCYAKIDGAYYHFDPTWDYSSAQNSGQNQYIYFGLSDARRFKSLSKECVSGFGALETVCDPTKAIGSLEIEMQE